MAASGRLKRVRRTHGLLYGHFDWRWLQRRHNNSVCIPSRLLPSEFDVLKRTSRNRSTPLLWRISWNRKTQLDPFSPLVCFTVRRESKGGHASLGNQLIHLILSSPELFWWLSNKMYTEYRLDLLDVCACVLFVRTQKLAKNRWALSFSLRSSRRLWLKMRTTNISGYTISGSGSIFQDRTKKSSRATNDFDDRLCWQNSRLLKQALLTLWDLTTHN